MGSESTTRPLSLSLALCVHVCVYTTPSRSLLSSLFSFSSREEEEEEEKRGGGRRKREKERTGGVGTRVETGLEEKVWESLHASGSTNARVITRSEGERGTVSRVHALFVRRHAWLSPSRTRAVRREGIRKKGTGVRGSSEPLVETRVDAWRNPRSRYERERASYFYMYGVHRTRDLRVAKISARLGEGRLEGRPFFTE